MVIKRFVLKWLRLILDLANTRARQFWSLNLLGAVGLAVLLGPRGGVGLRRRKHSGGVGRRP